MSDFLKFLSTSSILGIVWLSVQAVLLAYFIYYFPDLLFHPLP
ncbi:MAG TPA: photosystem I reaction center subunit IX [Oculatellaceae cyanobacterium]|uniref:Photosystem I reaction center subunit IX n=1 Tax=Crinalium epipsammum PCC 9333 TaxID=1173022 RepID=K9W0M3_9CYAN|nr:Photosystem I reaction center subunit IX [Crinalium epipsammum PCC 9333]